MMNLPFATHRGLIQPLTKRRHLKIMLLLVILRRFLQMVTNLKKSQKQIIHMLLSVAERDTRSRTGHNLRSIMIKTGRSDVQDLVPSDPDLVPYHDLVDTEWRVEVLEQLLEVRDQHGLNLEDQEWLRLNIFISYKTNALYWSIVLQ